MQITVEFVQTTCWCGLPIVVSPTLLRMHNEEGKSLYCPIGHGTVRQQTDNQKLQEQIADLEQQKRQVLEENGKLERKLQRVEAGCCPHCHRHFKNLERHIQTKHNKGK